ncbi:MAG: hypothetical protein IJY07_05020 [Clostridia bacterium]|nr:hypothetical protein [Clostridia bacterium]
MKKKILLVLLVVLMVGILAFSVFACNGDKKKDPVKNNNQTVDPDDEIEDVDYLTPMVTDVIGALDNTIATVTKIDKKASVSASIYVDVAVGEETYKVNLDIAGSIDQTAKAKNWAQIDANVLGVEVSLFAVNNGTVEDLYIAQNILNEEKEWNKLSQFEQANVLNNLACNSIIDLVKGIDETTKKQLSDGYINGVAGGILGMLSFVDGMNILVPGTGAGEDFATADGYNAALNVGGIASLLEMDAVSKLLAGLPADYHGIISTAINLLLGADLKFVTDEKTGAVSATFTPGAAEDTPTIELGFAVKDDLFKGLALSYEKGDISVQFGINNISLSADSKAYTTPYETEPEELAINLGLQLEDEKIKNGYATLDLNIYPNISMTFKNDYVDFDFSKLYAEVLLTYDVEVRDEETYEPTGEFEPETFTIAQYNADGNEDIVFTLTEVSQILGEGSYPDAYVFNVPVNIQEKFDKAMDKTKLNDQAKGYVAKVAEIDADKTLTADEKAEMKKKAYDGAVAFIIENTVYITADVDEESEESIEDQKKKLAKSALDGAIAAITGEASNALDKNVVDYVIEDIVPGLFKEDGSFNIGGVVGVLGQLGDIIEVIKPLAKYVDTSVKGEVTLDLEGLIGALLADEGIIGGSTKAKFGLYTGEGNEKAEKTLAEIMAPDAVLDNIAGLVNALVYEGAVAEADRETRTYADYYADADRLLTADEIIGLVEDFTGATLNKENAYANMSITLGGHAQAGIGASVSATLGADDATADIKLAIDANIIKNVEPKVAAEGEDPVDPYDSEVFYYQEDSYAIIDGKVVLVSNNTGVDGGKLLLNVIKQIFNGIVTNPDFELPTFSLVDTNRISSEAEGKEDSAIALEQDGTYAVSNGKWYSVMGAVGSIVTLTNNTAVSAVVVGGEVKSLADGSVVITIADANGLKFQINLVEGNELGLLDMTVAVPGLSYDAPVEGAGTYNLPAWMQYGYGHYFVKVTTTGAANISIVTTSYNQGFKAVGLASGYNEMNYMNPVMWAGDPVVGYVGEIDPESNMPAYVASGVIAVSEAGTYVIAIEYSGMGNSITIAIA